MVPNAGRFLQAWQAIMGADLACSSVLTEQAAALRESLDENDRENRQNTLSIVRKTVAQSFTQLQKTLIREIPALGMHASSCEEYAPCIATLTERYAALKKRALRDCCVYPRVMSFQDILNNLLDPAFEQTLKPFPRETAGSTHSARSTAENPPNMAALRMAAKWGQLGLAHAAQNPESREALQRLHKRFGEEERSRSRSTE